MCEVVFRISTAPTSRALCMLTEISALHVYECLGALHIQNLCRLKKAVHLVALHWQEERDDV